MTEPELDTLEDSPGTHGGEVVPVQPYLFVVLECDRPTSGGARYALAGVEEVVIGRGDKRDATRQVRGGLVRLRVCVPGRSISANHARLVRAGEGWVLEDTRSTNGSFINGQRVEQAALREGDVIEVGHTFFSVREALPTPKGTPQHVDVLENPALAPAFATLLPALGADFAVLARFIDSNLPLLLLGETGTGKELLARAFHRLSGRSGPFIAINCGALSPNLVESQLFGHVKGAFSGANRDEPGFIRAAQGGTLLLDEIGDLPLPAQPALLRVLQEEEVIPVGSANAIRVDVRFVAATHRPLDALAAENAFRSDLFARLDGYRFKLPLLKSRREDLGLIIAEILAAEKSAPRIKLTPDAGLALLAHDWPSNVRELVQQLRRGMVLAEDDLINRSHLHLTSREQHDATAYYTDPPISVADAKLRSELLSRLEKHHGNVADVARTMGKARMQIHRWMKRFGIDAARFRGVRTSRE